MDLHTPGPRSLIRGLLDRAHTSLPRQVFFGLCVCAVAVIIEYGPNGCKSTSGADLSHSWTNIPVSLSLSHNHQ